jgi:hypothetical protein
MHLAQHRVQWCDLLNTVINFRQRRGIFRRVEWLLNSQERLYSIASFHAVLNWCSSLVDAADKPSRRELIGDDSLSRFVQLAVLGNSLVTPSFVYFCLFSLLLSFSYSVFLFCSCLICVCIPLMSCFFIVKVAKSMSEVTVG